MPVLPETTRSMMASDYWAARASEITYSRVRVVEALVWRLIDHVYKKFTEFRAAFARRPFQEANLLIPVGKLIRPIFPTFTHRPNLGL